MYSTIYSTISMNKLLIVGTVAFDAIETPFGKTDKILGGAGTYIGLSASYFNIKSALISVVGEDFPEEYLNLLKNKKIDTSGIEIVKNGKTFFWSGRYQNDLNVRTTIETQLNVLAHFKPIVPKDYKETDILMLGNLHPSIQLDVLKQMEHKPKLTVLDTMNFWIDCALPELLEVIKQADILTINEEEARQLTGEYSLLKAAIKIRKMGPPFVVIKKGEHGALLFHKEEVFFAPALPLKEVFDPTGAGDAFAGGLVGYLTQSQNISFKNIKNAIIYGSNMASFCVEKFGLERLQNLSKDEIFERLQQFRTLTQFDISLSE